MVDLQGRFRNEVGRLGGRYVKNEYYPEGSSPERSTDVEIAIQLKEENKAFKVEKYVHSYPNCWRTDKPILYYPLDSWFIKVTDVREAMCRLNEEINWKQNLLGKVVLETGFPMPMTGTSLVLVFGYPPASLENRRRKRSQSYWFNRRIKASYRSSCF